EPVRDPPDDVAQGALRTVRRDEGPGGDGRDDDEGDRQDRALGPGPARPVREEIGVDVGEIHAHCETPLASASRATCAALGWSVGVSQAPLRGSPCGYSGIPLPAL